MDQVDYILGEGMNSSSPARCSYICAADAIHIALCFQNTRTIARETHIFVKMLYLSLDHSLYENFHP